MPLERALDVLELLAACPDGLTVIEIASRLDCPAAEVTHTIAVMQRRQWLRMGGHSRGLVLGPRMTRLTQDPKERG